MNQSLHPFAEPLTELSLDEIEERHFKLMNRWHIANRMQLPSDTLLQLDMLIQSLEEEKHRRMMVAEETQQSVVDFYYQTILYRFQFGQIVYCLM